MEAKRTPNELRVHMERGDLFYPVASVSDWLACGPAMDGRALPYIEWAG
jgi:hypothetical protein